MNSSTVCKYSKTYFMHLMTLQTGGNFSILFLAEEPLKGFQLWFAENKLSLSQVQGYEDDSAIQSSGLQVTQYFCRIMCKKLQ